MKSLELGYWQFGIKVLKYANTDRVKATVCGGVCGHWRGSVNGNQTEPFDVRANPAHDLVLTSVHTVNSYNRRLSPDNK